MSPTKRAVRSHGTENQAPNSPWKEDLVPAASESPSISFSPVKSRSPQKSSRDHLPSHALTEEALRENDTLAMAIDPEIRSASSRSKRTRDDDTASNVTGVAQGFPGMDDTCFSTFSAVPNVDMTRFANLTTSPSKRDNRSPTKTAVDERTPHLSGGRHTPTHDRHQHDEDYSSPTPRRQKATYDSGNDTTNLLVDFTDHFTAYPYPSRRSPTRRDHPSPKKYTTQPDLSSHGSTRGPTPSPSKYPLPPGTPNEPRHLANLLDFDLPPAPTPRSIPTISARELESMKSQFLSQISSLSASLSGKEAEANSLKQAVTDAERRVGEAQEQIRDERGAKEGLQSEKAELEQRQGEMQKVLKDVKEEIIQGDREKDALLQRVQEAEHKREEAEARMVEAESQIEGLRATAATTVSTPNNPSNEVEAAVTKVAKELHGLYKSKHEAKVTALKKSYSDRWEKKVRDLNNKIEELTKENEDLRVGRDATMSGLVPSHGGATNKNEDSNNSISSRASSQALAESDSKIKALEDKISILESELSSVKDSLAGAQGENHTLQNELEASRAETADLIAASEELIMLSSQPPPESSSSFAESGIEPVAMATTNPNANATRNSSHERRGAEGSGVQRGNLSRSTSGSGLKAPGFGVTTTGESRIGRMGGVVPPPVTGSRDRSGSNGVGRSGLLSNIERMGRGRDKE